MIDWQYINTASFFWLNHTAHELPDWFWSSLTITGHTSVVFALFAPLLLTQRGRSVITGLLVCSVLGGLVATLFKEYFQIPRPPAVLFSSAFYLIGHKLELVSFPSGHTLTAFAAATLLIVGLGLRGWRMLWVALTAGAIGLSRVAVGAHWPLDVLGGAILGVLCAYLSLFVVKKYFIHTNWHSSIGYCWLQITLLFVVSSSLIRTDMGYPAAHIWQWLTIFFGVMMSIYAAILQLKTVKRPEL